MYIMSRFFCFIKGSKSVGLSWELFNHKQIAITPATASKYEYDTSLYTGPILLGFLRL